MAQGDKQVRAIITAKDNTGSALGSFKGGLLAIGAAAAAVTAAFIGLSAAFLSAVKTAGAQQEADVALAAALRTTGQNTKEAREEISAFTDAMQDLTVTDDRVVKSVAGVLASLGQLHGEELKRSTKATLDFAAALGQDAFSAASLVAKAAGGMTSVLSRYGIQIAKNTPETEKFGAVLEQLEKKFGGIAEAMGKTFTGKLARVSNDLNDAAEQIGDIVVKSQGFNNILDILSQTAKGFQGDIKASSGLMKDFEQVLLDLALTAGQVIVALAEMTLDVIKMSEALASSVEWVSKLAEKYETLHGWLVPVDAELERVVANIKAEQRATEEAESASSAFGRTLTSMKETLSELGGALRREQDNLQRMAELERIVGEEGFNSVAGVRALREMLRMRGEGPQAVVDAIGNLPPAVEAGVVATTRLTDQLKELDAEADRIREDFDEAQGLLAFEAITEEEFDALVEGFKASGQAVIDAGGHIESWLTTVGLIPETVIPLLRQTADEADSLSDDITQGLVAEGTQGAERLGGAFVDAMFGAKASFADFAKTFLAEVAKMIAQLLIMKAIQFGLSFIPGAGPAIGVAANFGGTLVMAEGGEVKGGALGRDSVRALLTPGEIVLPARMNSEFDAIADMAKAFRDGGGGVGGGVTIPLTVTGEDDDRKIARLVERLSDAVVREGFTLVASETA